MTNPGEWTDVCVLPDGRFLQVAVEGRMVRGFIAGVEQWQIEAPEKLLFCRCALWQGRPISIHQGNDSGFAYLVTPTTVIGHGPTFGAQPVAIDDTYAYIVRTSDIYDKMRLDDGMIESFASGAPGSSQGISDVVNGKLWWADLHRTMEVSGLTLTYPNVRGGVVVGQADPPQIAGVAMGEWFTAILGDGFEPHLAWNGSTYAIVARTPTGAAYTEVPPYPPFVGAPVPPEPPSPSPSPEPPEPTPVPPQPIPPPLRRHLRIRMELNGKTVILRGPAGKLATPDAPNTGTWAELHQGWRGLLWADPHASDPSTRHVVAKVGDRYTFTNAQNHGLLGADATKHSGAIDQQFYYKPDGNTDADGYELWQVYDGNANGALEAQIEYSNDEGKYFACPLAVEVV